MAVQGMNEALELCTTCSSMHGFPYPPFVLKGNCESSEGIWEYEESRQQSCYKRYTYTDNNRSLMDFTFMDLYTKCYIYLHKHITFTQKILNTYILFVYTY